MTMDKDDKDVESPEDIAHPALHGMRVLKHDATFGLFDEWGDIKGSAGGAEGVFHNDTRILSLWKIATPGMSLRFLSGGLDGEGLVFESHLSSAAFKTPDGIEIPENALYVRRRKFIHDGTLHESVSVANYSDYPLSLALSFAFGSDFRDLFEVRGIARERRGCFHPASMTGSSCTSCYTGLDGIDRACIVTFSEAPDRIDEHSAAFSLTLARQEEWTIYASASVTDNALDFGSSLARLRADFLAKKAQCRSVSSEDPAFNSWAEASRDALTLLTTTYETGPYPCAGTPWFSVPFGRDGIITAFQTLPFNPGLTKGVLAYLAAHQATDYDTASEAEPGKILHETRACEMAMTGEVAFKKYYGSVDATPLFLMLAGAYLAASGDRGFIASIRPALSLALTWVETDGDADGDGFLEYMRKTDKGLATQGWKDSHDSVFHRDGTLADAPVAFCEVQGYAYAARLAMADMMDAFGEAEKSARLRRDAEALYTRFNETFWIEDGGFYALALDGTKKPCAVRSSNMGHLLWCGIVPENRAERVAAHLMNADCFTGWGIRTIARGESRYSPLSYHNGSVWPHDTAIAAAGLARYGHTGAAVKILSGLFDLAKLSGRMFLPELVCGFAREDGMPPVSYPTACIPQAWASGAFFMLAASALGVTLRNGVLDVSNPTALDGLVRGFRIEHG